MGNYNNIIPKMKINYNFDASFGESAYSTERETDSMECWDCRSYLLS